jgi:hypothetical protein
VGQGPSGHEKVTKDPVTRVKQNGHHVADSAGVYGMSAGVMDVTAPSRVDTAVAISSPGAVAFRARLDSGALRQVTLESLPNASAPLPVKAGKVEFSVRPNPVLDDLAFGITLAAPTSVRVDVFDALGRFVARPINGPMGAGQARIAWRPRSERGETLGSGLYFARIVAGPSTTVRRFTLVR